MAVAALALAAAPSARANAELEFISGASSVIVVDNGSGDSNPTTGIIDVTNLTVGTFDVSVGADAITYPILGTLTEPELDISSLDVSSGTGSLEILFSDTGFGPTTGAITSAIGGTVNSSGGSISYATYYSTANTLFGQTTELSALGPYGSGAFSGSAVSSLVSLGSPYSLTQVITITHSAGGASSFDASLVTVPDGGWTVALLGVTLGGLEMLRRKMAGTREEMVA